MSGFQSSAPFAMGGYAAFVWPAYGAPFAVLGGFALHSWRRYRPASANSTAAATRPRR